MTPTENKAAYDAFKKMCQVNKNFEPLAQLEIMVRGIGAERTHILSTLNSGLPPEVKDIMLGVCRHIETECKIS